MDVLPLISVILPVYNVAQYLEDCMNSILSQTYHNLDILLIDDGSTDGSAALCDSFAKADSRVRVFHKKNGGVSDARNFGIHCAAGEFITFVDSDDYVDTDYVSYLFYLITKYHTNMSIGQHRVAFDNGKTEDFGARGDLCMDNRTCLERMLYHDVIDTSAWGKLYRKELFQSVSYPTGKLFEDMATTYKLFLLCPQIAVGYEAKYNYNIRKNSITTNTFSLKKLDLLDATDQMAADVLNIFPSLYHAAKRRQVYSRFSTLNQMLALKSDEYQAERRQIIQFIKCNASEILRNPKAPKRDKLGLLLLLMGLPIYRLFWLSYLYVKKGR